MPELNEAGTGRRTNSLISSTIFAKTNVLEKQISEKYTTLHRSLSGINGNGDWKRKSWGKVRLLWAEDWVGCEKGKPVNGDSSFEKFFKKGRKETGAEAGAVENTRKIQGVGGIYSTNEDPFFWGSKSRAEWVLMPSSWGGNGKRTASSCQEAGGGHALSEESVSGWGFALEKICIGRSPEMHFHFHFYHRFYWQVLKKYSWKDWRKASFAFSFWLENSPEALNTSWNLERSEFRTVLWRIFWTCGNPEAIAFLWRILLWLKVQV